MAGGEKLVVTLDGKVTLLNGHKKYGLTVTKLSQGNQQFIYELSDK